MSLALAALANGLTAKFAPAPVNSAAASMTASMQLLIPATSWDWPTDTNGTSSAALYDFCSFTPESCSPAEAFAPSTTRFSDGYQLFLQCLPPDVLTAQALTAFADATYYTTVLYGESGQPRLPAWNISQFPQAWLAAVAGGSSTAGTIHVALPTGGEPAGPAPGPTCFGVTSPGGTSTPVRLGPGPGQFVDIHADAWGQITVRPAGWYNGALVALKSAGPFATGTAGTFFGPAGLLRNLLTGLCVALHPTVTASVTPDFAARLEAARRPGSALRVGGLTFDSFHTGTNQAGPGGTVSLTASGPPWPTEAVIVGAAITPLRADPG